MARVPLLAFVWGVALWEAALVEEALLEEALLEEALLEVVLPGVVPLEVLLSGDPLPAADSRLPSGARL